MIGDRAYAPNLTLLLLRKEILSDEAADAGSRRFIIVENFRTISVLHRGPGQLS
jgi:hypothetical protein